jgi:hypothetical protein
VAVTALSRMRGGLGESPTASAEEKVAAAILTQAQLTAMGTANIAAAVAANQKANSDGPPTPAAQELVASYYNQMLKVVQDK